MKQLKKLPDKELDGITLSYWHSLAHDPAFIKILNYCEYRYKEKYSEGTPESIHPHIQAERNGGQKGWNRLMSHLLNAPQPQIEENSVTELQPNKKRKFIQEDFAFSHLQ